jgi:hypothetical protein
MMPVLRTLREGDRREPQGDGPEPLDEADRRASISDQTALRAGAEGLFPVTDLRDVVGQALLRHHAIGIIDDRDNAVVGMQINSAVHHLRLLVVKSDSMITNLP